MVVIGEEYLLMNLLMDTLCLTAAMRLSSLRARPGRVLLSALAGALLSMIALSLWGLRASAYAALPIAVLMALLAFGLRRAPGGSARLRLSYCEGNAGGKFRLLVNGELVVETTLANTGTWTDFMMIEFPLENVLAGESNTIRLECGGAGYNPDWIQLIYETE